MRDTPEKRPPSLQPLEPKEARFVAAYARHLNSIRAVEEAGYININPRSQASILLRKPRIKVAIALKQAEQIAVSDLAAGRVKQELARIAFFDPLGCFAVDGRPLHVHEMPPEVRAAVKSVRVIARDGVPVVSTIEFWSKIDALKLAAQHLALLAPKEVTVTHRFPHASLSDAELKQRLLESANAIEGEVTE